MLSPLSLLAAAIRRLRYHYKLSQRQFAALVGCSQSYVAQVERAHRPPSYRYALRLEELFELEPGTYTNHRFLRGRPPMSAQSKAVRKDLVAALPVHPPGDFTEKRPRLPRPNVCYGLDNPFGAMRPGTACGDDLLLLEQMRSSDERFWRQANSVCFDSFTEKRFLIKLALQGAQLIGVGSQQLGSQLAMVCGKKGKPYRRRAPAAFLLKVGELSIALYPQRCVRTQGGHRWPDYLAVAALGGRKITVVLEINGPDWHANVARERKRDLDLGVPVYHLCASQVESPDALPGFFDWVLAQFRSA